MRLADLARKSGYYFHFWLFMSTAALLLSHTADQIYVEPVLTTSDKPIF